MTLVHLHAHSEFSALDGLSTAKEMARLAAADSQPALAVTDHGTCAAHPVFQIACEAEGVKPIFGMEAYFVDDRFERKEGGKKPSDYWHLILLAMDDEGLKNLWAMSTESYRDGLWGKYARLDWDTLRRLNKGVIATTACLGGPVLKPFIKGNEELAVSNLLRLQEIFGDRLYAEIQPGSHSDQRTGNEWLIETADRHRIPLLAAVDSHYPTPDDKQAHKVWVASAIGKTLDELADSTMFEGDEDYHLMTEAEVREHLAYLDSDVVDRAIETTVEIADRCTAKIALSNHNPVYSRKSAEVPDPARHDIERLLEDCLARWDERTTGKSHDADAYMDRFETEFGLIAEKGFAGYFLMVADLVGHAKENGILVGPGRGSGGGSLVAYLLGITEIDPVEHDVLFERFMTKGRTELPDFDIDFPSSKKAEMYGYVARRWGKDNVATVGTHMRLKSKSAIQAVARALKSSLPEDHWPDVMACSAIIETAEGDTAGLGLSWDELWDRAGDALEPYAEKYPRVFELARQFHSRLKSYGKHPAGVIIDPDAPLTENLPLRMGEDGQMIAQFDLKVLEMLGYVKFDLLNISNLDMLQRAMDLIRERTGKIINPYAWVDELEDPYLYEQISEGHTLGLFQMGTPTGTTMCRRMKPTGLHELADLVTLVRPGPARSGLTDAYLARRKGEAEMEYLDPRLEPVFGKTWAAMIYQEQLMKACMVMAGFDDVEADKVRKVLGKKKVEEAKKLGQVFIRRAIENNTEEIVARELWGQMEEFARYCVAGDTRIHLAASGPHSDGTVTAAELHRKLHSKLPAFANAGQSTGAVGRPASDFAGPCVCCDEFAAKYIRGYCQNRCEAWLRKFRDPNKGLYALSYFADGRIRPARVLDVVESGVQELFRITLVSGHTIDATAGHRHLTPAGYREVRDLAVGDELMVDLGYDTHQENRRLTTGDRRSVGTVNGAFGASNYGFVDGGYAVWKEWRETHERVCSQCGSRDNVQQAHLNGNEKDNRPSNYAWLCQPCHSRYDYAVNDRRRRWQKGHRSAPSAIVSVESIGTEMTYDVVMEAPHNFVANGIVTHNSFGYAHALAYAILGVWTAWFKFHYPLYFLTAALSTVEADKYPAFVEEARRMGYKVLPPDINLSGRGFGLGDTGLDIRFGIDSVKGVGPAAVETIIANQPYSSWEDFRERSGANSGVTKTLVRIGAFDSLVPNRKYLERLLEHEAVKDAEKCVHRGPETSGVVWLATPKRGQEAEPEKADWSLPCSYDWLAEPDEVNEATGKKVRRRPPPKKCSKACRRWEPVLADDAVGTVAPYTDKQVREIEQEMLGIFLSSTPFDAIPAEDLAEFATAEDVETGPNGTYMVAALLSDHYFARNRTDMGFVKLATPRGTLSAVCFPDEWEQFFPLFRKGQLVYTSLAKTDRGQTLKVYLPIDDTE